MQVLRLHIADDLSKMVLEDLTVIGPFAQWTMDCKLQSCGNGTHHDAAVLTRAQIAVGLSDNAVEMYELKLRTASLVRLCQTLCILHIESCIAELTFFRMLQVQHHSGRCQCLEQSLLYSMSLYMVSIVRSSMPSLNMLSSVSLSQFQ